MYPLVHVVEMLKKIWDHQGNSRERGVKILKGLTEKSVSLLLYCLGNFPTSAFAIFGEVEQQIILFRLVKESVAK